MRCRLAERVGRNASAAPHTGPHGASGRLGESSNYYLQRGDYEQAWQWYEKSAEQRARTDPIKLSEIGQFVRQLRIHQDSSFFEYYCLTKLQRYEEASRRLRQFRRAMRFDLQDADEFLRRNLPDAQLQAELASLASFATPLIQGAYIAEVYLSLDANADGIEFFRRELREAATAPERLACALCLNQLLLIDGDRQAYAELAVGTLAPLLMEMHQPAPSPEASQLVDFPVLRRQIQQQTLNVAGGLSLLPLMSDRFVSSLPSEMLPKQLARWQLLRKTADDDTERAAVDLILLAILTRLGADEQRTLVEQRLRSNTTLELPSSNDTVDIDVFIDELRAFWAPE